MTPIAQAAEAHRDALAAREAMDAAAARRGAAIRTAMAAGHTAPEIAKALGVKRERIYAMAKQQEVGK